MFSGWSKADNAPVHSALGRTEYITKSNPSSIVLRFSNRYAVWKGHPSETPEDVLTKEAAGEVFSVDTYGNPQVGRASCTSCGDQQAKSTGSDGTQFSRNPQRSDEPAIVPLHQFVRLDELNFQTPRKITLRIW